MSWFPIAAFCCLCCCDRVCVSCVYPYSATHSTTTTAFVPLMYLCAAAVCLSVCRSVGRSVGRLLLTVVTAAGSGLSHQYLHKSDQRIYLRGFGAASGTLRITRQTVWSSILSRNLSRVKQKNEKKRSVGRSIGGGCGEKMNKTGSRGQDRAERGGSG